VGDEGMLEKLFKKNWQMKKNNNSIIMHVNNIDHINNLKNFNNLKISN
jgi:hypothetical protein